MFLIIIAPISPLNCLKDFRKSCVYSSIWLLLYSATFLWKPVWLQKMPFNGTCCVWTSWSFIQTPWWWKNPSLSFPWLTLNHAILMDKLKYYGLNETSLNWFRSYLHDRQQYTEYDGTCSDVINLTTGVPQGSILGPLLFIIYMNDIHVATSNFKAILYANALEIPQY